MINMSKVICQSFASMSDLSLRLLHLNVINFIQHALNLNSFDFSVDVTHHFISDASCSAEQLGSGRHIAQVGSNLLISTHTLAWWDFSLRITWLARISAQSDGMHASCIFSRQ